jgi:tol-pal system protein YbgF
LVLLLAGCGKPHAELQLQHRIAVLEQQVQELQKQEAAQAKVSPQEQKQQEKSESLPATQDKALELSPKQEKEPAQNSKAKEQEPAEPQGQVRLEYKQALDTLLQGNPDQAQRMFEEFLKEHKKHELAPNAYYWLGECHYEKQSFAEAILAFKEVSNQYPDSDKVPDALLKMGYSYLNMGQKSNASFYLETLKERYPDSKAAELAQKKLAELEP